jgi:hypothetical protein
MRRVLIFTKQGGFIMETISACRCTIILLLLILVLCSPLRSETIWSENFTDGNFTADPAWNVPWGQVDVVPYSGGHVLDVHALPMGLSGRLYAELPDLGFGGTDEFRLEFCVRPRETLTDHNNVRIQIYNWETYDVFELMENDNDNLQLRINGATISQVPLNGFPQRWHHVVMHRLATGYWTIIWDQGGSNQTVIQGQDLWVGSAGLVPILQLQCDGHYNAVNGAYFDNIEMWHDSSLVWHDNFNDGNYTADPPWNIPSGEVSVAMLDGNYVLDNRALPNWTSGRIYAPWPVSAVTGLNDFRLELDVRPRETMSSANNVRIQIFNWNSLAYFELMENDNDNLQLRFNGQIVTQTPLNGFPDRWHHVIMERCSPNHWTVIWDAGGPNQTTLEGQDNWYESTIPYLTLQCDGYYSTVNGAYFDNLVMSIPPYIYPGEFTVDDHTAALWHFNENSGLMAHDATLHHYDMALQDGAGWHTPGWNNTPSAADMTDEDAKLNSNYTVGNGWDAITLEAWIYPTRIGPYTGWFCDHPIITRQEFHNVSDCSYFLFLTAKGEIYAGVNLNQPGGPVSQALTDSGLIQVNNWYHVAATWSSGEPLRIFINDMTNPVEVSSQMPSGTIRAGTDALRLGCNWVVEYYNMWEYFQGYIDEARISEVDRYPTSSTSSLDIALTPVNPPLVIPPGGGSFFFNAVIENVSSATQNFDLWTTIQVPGGSQFTSFGPLNLNLESGGSIVRLRTQAVPANAPAGQYFYRGFVGDHPWSVIDADSFSFAKAGDLRDWFGPEGWVAGGEPFPGEEAVNHQPAAFGLQPCSPNPFNASTVVRYKMQDARQVSLKVYDVSGRLVATLAEGWREAGSHEAVFDGSNLASGIYLAKLEAGEFTAVQKLVLLK